MKVASLVARAILSFHGFGQVFWPSLFSDSWFNFVCLLHRAGELACGMEQAHYCLLNTKLIVKSAV